MKYWIEAEAVTGKSAVTVRRYLKILVDTRYNHHSKFQ